MCDLGKKHLNNCAHKYYNVFKKLFTKLTFIGQIYQKYQFANASYLPYIAGKSNEKLMLGEEG